MITPTIQSADRHAMAVLAGEHNLTVDHTGGGCLAYALHGLEGGWYFWLTGTDGGTLPDSPDENSFGGFYHDSGDWWVCIEGTARDLLSVMWTLEATAREMFDTGENHKNVDDLPLRAYLVAAQGRGLIHDEEHDAAEAILARPEAPEAPVEAPPVGEGLHDAFDCEKALQIAQDVLKQASEISPWKPEYRKALATIDAILAQRGCEHLDAAVRDGKLTTAMDVAIFG